MIGFLEGRDPVQPEYEQILKKKVGLSVYQITNWLRLKYTNSNNGLNYLIENVPKILLICKIVILEFLNVDFILAWTVNLLKIMVFICNKLITILLWTYVS